jgi:hypothetical protein
MKLRVYTYKITFDEIPHWYWGVHKERVPEDGYLGSPCTHKWMWDFYTPHLQICEVFPYTDEGWAKAQMVEKNLIRHDLQNPLCLNEGCGNVLSLEACKLGGKTQGKKNKNRVHTEKAIANMKAGHATPESKKKRSRVTLEVFKRPEVLESVKEKAIERWETRKEELSASMRGVKNNYHWWVNRNGETKCCPESPGSEWQTGRVWKTL